MRNSNSNNSILLLQNFIHSIESMMCVVQPTNSVIKYKEMKSSKLINKKSNQTKEKKTTKK